MAHYALFFVGGFVIYLILEICLDAKNKGLISIAAGMALAFCDEFHQYYSKNRGPKLSDVCIDTFGVISGTMVCMFVIKIVKIFYKKIVKGKKIYDKLQKNNSNQNCRNS